MIPRLPSPWVRVLLWVWIFASALHCQQTPVVSPAHPSGTGEQDPEIAAMFNTAHFDRFAAEGPRQEIRWKIHALSHGLSVHQRMVAHIELEIPGSELVARATHGKLIALVQVADEEGHRYRDFGLIDLAEVKPELRKQTWQSTWEAFALPGHYNVSLLLYDPRSGERSFAITTLRVEGLKNDAFAEVWQGLPKWEFWAPLKETRDVLYRPDIDSRLNLRLAGTRRLQVEVLADLTPSDLFHGSSRFYSHFLAVALPLLKDLSQIKVPDGSLNVSTLDLRQHRVTFEQDTVTNLDWAMLRTAVAPENGPGMINVKGLQQKREEPDFLRDELLRRLEPGYGDHSSGHRDLGTPGHRSEPGDSGSDEAQGSKAHTLPDNSCTTCSQDATAEGPMARYPDGPTHGYPGEPIFKVFIVIGSPMDFYAFHHFPPIDPAETENCVVYYLQYEVYGPYATGALGNVRKMLKPLVIHTIKVHSAESVRQALARIVRETGKM